MLMVQAAPVLAHVPADSPRKVEGLYAQFVALQATAAAQHRLPVLADAGSGPVLRGLWDLRLLGQRPYDAHDLSRLTSIAQVATRMLAVYGVGGRGGPAGDADYQDEIARAETFAIYTASDLYDAYAAVAVPALHRPGMSARVHDSITKVAAGSTSTFQGVASTLDGALGPENTHMVADAIAANVGRVVAHLSSGQRNTIIAALASGLGNADAHTRDAINTALAALGSQECDALCAALGPAGQGQGGGGIAATSAPSASVPSTSVSSATVSSATVPSASAPSAATSGTAAGAALSPDAAHVVVGAITMQGSNVSRDVLRAVFSGDVASHAAAIAHLNATSIVVAKLSVTSPAAGGKSAPGLVYSDIELRDVVDGVARSARIGGIELAGTPANLHLGPVSVQQLDLGALLAFYGPAAAGPAGTPRPLYSHFTMAGGTLSVDGGNCVLGPITAEGVSARAPGGDWAANWARLSRAGRSAADGQAAMPAMARMAGDLFDSVRVSPVTVVGFSCSILPGDGSSVALAIGRMQIGAWTGKRYPQVEVDNVNLAASQGNMAIDKLVLKPIDLSRMLAAIEHAPAGADPQWLSGHLRSILPDFGGLQLAGLRMDIPDTGNGGQRLRMSLAGFDLSLLNYRNGMPTQISSATRHLVLGIPSGSTDPGMRNLLDAGIHQLDLSYDLSAAWDERTAAVTVKDLAVEARGLGSVDASAVLGNASPDLFSSDATAELKAAMALTLKRLAVKVVDAGLGPVIMARVAKEQKTSLDAVRARVSGIAQAAVLATLGGSPEAASLASAIGRFLNGGATLSATLSAKRSEGVGFATLAALRGDPSRLTQDVAIRAEAQ